MTMPPEPLHAVALGRLSVDTLDWTLGGTAFVTVAAKAMLQLVPGGQARLADPEPVRRDDHHTLPGPIVRAPRELVPSLPQPEVTLIGHAHASGAATEVSVRLAVLAAGGAPLIDKTLHVWGRTGRDGQRRAVSGLQLDYCGAVGGLGDAANPLGKGRGLSAEQSPSIVDPRDPDAVAGFCPVPAGFAARVALLGGVDAASLAGGTLLPADFDQHYFQAAPPDQRVAALVGDERIVLDHMSAAEVRIDTQLPGLWAVAKLYTDAGSTPLPLRLESLHIDADALTASLVWRATVARPADGSAVAVQLQGEGLAPAWPTTLSAQGLASHIAARAGITLDDGTGTAAFGGTGTVSFAAPKGEALPFAPPDIQTRRSTAQAPSTPGAPWALAETREVPAPRESQTETVMVIGGSTAAAVDRAAEGRSQEERLAEARRAEVAAERARVEQRARASEAAERFAREQDAARQAEAERRATQIAERRAAIKRLKDGAYGGFE